MKNTKPWCVEPFVNLSHTTDGWYQPCCIAQVKRNSNMNTFEMSPLEYMNSDYMKKLRKDMIEGNISKDIEYACKSCLLNEQKGIISRRIKQSQKFNVDNAVQYSLKNNYEIHNSLLQYVNLKVLGNICNLKCIMCNPNSSSKIAAEYKKYNITNVDKSIQVSYDDSNKEKYFQDLNKILESIDRFSLIGGEAFVHPDFEEIFNLILDNKNSKNIELFIITNGTIIPQYILDNTDKFRKITLNFSIDGVGEKAEYIRNGLRWSDFDKNLKRALKSEVSLAFTIAVQMLNIGYLDEIYKYINSLGVDASNVVGWNNLVTHPRIFNPTNIPLSIKRKYKEKYEKIGFNKINDSINKTLEILDTDNSDVEDYHYIEFIKFMKKIDYARGNCLTSIFPEFKEYNNITKNIKY